MRIMTPHDAAKVVKGKMGNEPQPLSFSASVMEGRHIPNGTFDEFVRECEGLGLLVHSYWLNETAIISGR